MGVGRGSPGILMLRERRRSLVSAVTSRRLWRKAGLFTEFVLEAPKPVPVMRADHRIAQKPHAVSSEGSERARNLVDLQPLDKSEDLDLARVAAACVRLFNYRRQQAWSPPIVAGDHWDTLYAKAVEGLDVLLSVEEAVVWANGFVQRTAAAG